MTKAVFTVKEGRIVRIAVDGHTGYAAEGEDVVCAALSAVLQGAVLGVMQVAKAQVEYKTDARKGQMQFALREGQEQSVLHDAEVILRSALVATKDIAEGYSQFVKVEVKEL